ncbi:MAG: YbaB/EbfC family nucleoid-associated protein [Hyphomicrobiaceae bacterium]|nr:YbaB/EbfC family nucleoid-associated protein [Hyphomicrobiaceae bacterium]
MDFLKMMGQAKAMKAAMEELNAEIAETVVEGTSGGGLVKVRLRCKGEMTGLDIDPSLVRDEDAEVLADLIMAANNDARAKADATIAERTTEMMGKFGVPAGGIPGL